VAIIVGFSVPTDSIMPIYIKKSNAANGFGAIYKAKDLWLGMGATLYPSVGRLEPQTH